MLARLVRFVNIGIATLVVVVLAGVYWLAIRPLPQTSGELTAPVAKNAKIERDARGVPHITADSMEDAMFLQGYVTAQDRLWQMDALRRAAAGELAELMGPALVERDKQMRLLRMKAIAEANVDRLTPEDRAVFVEYARGVNYFIETHRGNYSLEFSIPFHSYDPRPWTLTDSMLVGLMMYRDLTDSLIPELAKGLLLQEGADPAKFRVLFPAVQGSAVNPGSNAWVVSGAHSATGKPILANDPHLRYTVPGIWYQVHLKTPQFNVTGVTLPGVAGVIAGHNENIAWGVTNLSSDVMDLYEEHIDLNTGRYMFAGKEEQAQAEQQVILVNGSAPVTAGTWITKHGPVFADHGKTYSIRWTAAEGFAYPFLRVDQAKNWQEFRAAIEPYWGPGQNFVYADRQGNIGYQATGRVPIRRGFDGNVPLDGWSGKFEWDGYIPWEQMPSVYNPTNGVIATANQNPFPKDYPYEVGGNYADRYRVEQIRNRLTVKAKLNVEDMLALQKDVYSSYDLFLARQAAAAFAKAHHAAKGELLKAAVETLNKWNGQMEWNEAAPAVTELLSQHLQLELLKCMAPRLKEFPDLKPRPEVIETLLKQRPRGWVPNDDWDAWLITAFGESVEEGRAKFGSAVSEWKWGYLLNWRLDHPVTSHLAPVEWVFNLFFRRSSGPFAMSGASTTVKQTTPVLGPSERMVVDLGDLENSRQNLLLGESGSIASSHYEDQWKAYYDGKSFPMGFDKIEVKETLIVKPQ